MAGLKRRSLQAVEEHFPSLAFTCLTVQHSPPFAPEASVAAVLEACAHAPASSRVLAVNAGCCQTPKAISNALGNLLGLPDFTNASSVVPTASSDCQEVCRAISKGSSAARQQGVGSWMTASSEPAAHSTQRTLNFQFFNELAPELDQPVSRNSLAAYSARTSAQSVEALEEAGVFFQDAATCWIGPSVTIGMDCYIGPGVQIYGSTEVRCQAAS